MYVAITRARKRLYLSFAQTRHAARPDALQRRSRFFDELPKSLVKWLTPKMGAAFAHESFAAAEFAKPKRTADPGHGFRIGQQVLHAKFGQGVIVDAEGSGPEARLQVNFGHAGMKWLALAYANLQPA